jgi:site-specific DNA-methyltransferase (adenine-specific)
MKTLPDNSVDSIVCDPPYDLTAGKKGGTGVASVNLDSPYGRARIGTGNGAGGFMGMKWDGTGVAFDVETWRQCLRVLKPGGHLLAFSGTRTQHRMVCAIEDAGFEIRDQIGWAFGSGFPKSHNGPWGGTALKPAWEPICMARKPLIGTVEANWRERGTGALNIDGCRVPVDAEVDASQLRTMQRSQCEGDDGWGMSAVAGDASQVVRPEGRWPANLLHDGGGEVVALFPQSAGQQGDVRGTEPSRVTNGIYGEFAGRVASPARSDTGSAARFFWSPKATRADRNDGCYDMPEKRTGGMQATADGSMLTGSGNARTTTRANVHPTVKPTDLMRYLCRLVTPPGGTVLDPFMGSGSTLKAAEIEGFSAIGIELLAEYIEIAKRRIGADAPLFSQVESPA